MAHSVNPSVWIERKKTKGGFTKYRVRGEVDGRRLPAGPWTPKATWAQEEKARLEARLWAGERETATRRRQMTYDAFHADYEKRREVLVPGTWDRFDKHALASFGIVGKAKGCFLRDINKEMVDAWVLAMMKDGYGHTTVDMRLRSITTFFNDAKARELVSKNPCEDVSSPGESEGGRALREHEVTAIFSIAPPELWRAGLWDLNCGPRLGEVVLFDWSMVEDEKVHGAPVWFGRIPSHLRKARQKVKKDCRFPINETAMELMGTRQRSGIVFPYPRSTLQHQFTDTRTKAGVEGASFHWLRHTFATRFLARGGHIEDLLETKLWADYKSLLRYVHLDDETLLRRFQGAAQPIIPPLSPRKAKSPTSD